MSSDRAEFDVVVVGAGNAALSAALSAMEAGAKVLVLEKSPREHRGGNTRFTALYRFAYDGLPALRGLCSSIDDQLAERMVVPPYPADAFLHDLMATSSGHADRSLMQILAEESLPAMQWLTDQGVTWVPCIEGAKQVGDKLTWQPGIIIRPDGGGMAVLDLLFQRLERGGAEIRYNQPVEDLVLDESGSRIAGVRVRDGSGRQTIVSASVILGAGGFEASAEKRAAYLGEGWDMVKVRGSRYNTGECLSMAIRAGAGTTGQWSGCHATMVHASSDDFELGDAAFPHAYPLSVVVNLDGERFADEGESFQYYTYAKLGRAVLRQRDGQAFQVFDSKTIPLRAGDWLGDRVYQLPHERSSDLGEAARNAGIRNVDRFLETIANFNKAVMDGEFDPSRLDGKCTRGLAIDKSNWALPIDSPPYEIVPVQCGITFTFGGLRFDEHAQVLDSRQRPITGLYVVGEMAGTFFVNYAGGSGLTKGTVFGRRAGLHAAAMAHQRRIAA